MICKYFLPFCRMPFYFVDGFFCCTDLFSNACSPMCWFDFVAFVFGVKSKKSLPRQMSENAPCHIFFWAFYGFRYYIQVFNPI